MRCTNLRFTYLLIYLLALRAREALQVGLQRVLVTLSLSTARTCTFLQFTAEDGLW